MSAYQLGLTGKAADLAVHKQKQHRSVSQAASSSNDGIGVNIGALDSSIYIKSP